PAGDNVSIQMGPPADSSPRQKWTVVADAQGRRFIHNVALPLERVRATQVGNAWYVDLRPKGVAPAYYFRFVSTGVASNTVPADALARWQAADARLSAAQARLIALKAVVVADEPQRAAWRARLVEVTALLGQLGLDMGRRNREILTALAATL